MNEIQNYLKDLLIVDCKIQNNLQNLLQVTSYDALESKSIEIKAELKDFKNILSEMKDFCDSFSSINNQYENNILRRLNLPGKNSNSESEFLSSPPKDILDSEYKIQKERLTNDLVKALNKFQDVQKSTMQKQKESNERARANMSFNTVLIIY